MMKESALNKIMTKLLDNKKREADEEHDRIHKRRKPNEQTVPTQNGEHGMHARYRTQRRDGLQVDQRQQKDAKALMTKLENAKNLLQDYDTQLRKFNERHPRTTVPVASDDGSEDADGNDCESQSHLSPQSSLQSLQDQEPFAPVSSTPLTLPTTSSVYIQVSPASSNYKLNLEYIN